MEAGIYLAAGGYSGATGCVNFLITGCQVFESANNGILLIGGSSNTVQACNVVRSGNAAIMQFHGLDNRIIGNSIYDCNRTVHNGIGAVNGDAYGAIAVDGNSDIGAGSYAAIIQNNSMMKCNQGGESSIIGISIDRDTADAYPTASNKIVVDSNNTDAAVRSFNPNSFPVVATADAGGSFSLGPTEIVSATDEDAELRVRSTGADTSAGLAIEIIDTSVGNDESRLWEIKTRPGDHNELVFTHLDNTNVRRYPIRIFGDGRVSFSGATSATQHVTFQEPALFKEKTYFWGDLDGSAYNSDADFGTGSVKCSTIEKLLRTDTTNNPGVALTNESYVRAGNPFSTGSQNITCDYTLPANPYDGRRIEFIGDHYGNNGASPSVLQITIGDNSDHITAGSVGTLGNYQNNQYYSNTSLVMSHGHYVALFAKSTRSWAIAGTPTAGP